MSWYFSLADRNYLSKYQKDHSHLTSDSLVGRKRLVHFEISFWYLQFSQKTNEKKKIDFTTMVPSASWIVFVCFLGELKIPKRHFEINWPLGQVTTDLPK